MTLNEIGKLNNWWLEYGEYMEIIKIILIFCFIEEIFVLIYWILDKKQISAGMFERTTDTINNVIKVELTS